MPTDFLTQMATRITPELVLSICAIFLTIYQATQTRRHNRLSVRPHLAWGFHTTINDLDIHLTFSVKNNGIGPAIITDRFFLLDGQRFDAGDGNEVPLIAKSLISDVFRYHLYRDGLPGLGTAITAGSEFVVAHLIFFGDQRPTGEQLNQMMRRAAFGAKYESLYGDKFIL